MAERQGKPQGGCKSEVGKAAYWRMQWESCIGALADLIAEHTETVEENTRLSALVTYYEDKYNEAHDVPPEPFDFGDTPRKQPCTNPKCKRADHHPEH